MKLCLTMECYCGDKEEDLHNVLWYCQLYEEMKREILNGIVRPDSGPIYYAHLVSSAQNF